MNIVDDHSVDIKAIVDVYYSNHETIDQEERAADQGTGASPGKKKPKLFAQPLPVGVCRVVNNGEGNCF